MLHSGNRKRKQKKALSGLWKHQLQLFDFWSAQASPVMPVVFVSASSCSSTKTVCCVWPAPQINEGMDQDFMPLVSPSCCKAACGSASVQLGKIRQSWAFALKKKAVTVYMCLKTSTFIYIHIIHRYVTSCTRFEGYVCSESYTCDSPVDVDLIFGFGRV